MIKFVSALCGSGKTEFALNLSKELIKKKMRVLFVCPSLELQNEISKRLNNTPHRIINYKNTIAGQGVVGSIEKYLRRPAKYEILIITHASFKSISHFPNKKNWTVFIDEETEIFDFMSFNSCDAANYGYGNDLIEDMLKISTFSLNEGGFTSIQPKSLSKSDKGYLKSISYGGKDSTYVYPPFQKFIQHLLNPNMALYGDTTTMVAFRFGDTNAEMWAELDTNIFEDFADLYLMGAEIQRSKLAAYLNLKGIKTENLLISKRFETHDQPIIIKWMTTHSPWSKNYYNEPNKIESTVTNFELYDMLVGLTIGEEEILVQNNIGNPFKHIKNMIQMNFEIKGLNKYNNYAHYAESGAYNVPPACNKKMTDLGFDMEELQLHHALSHAYQGFLRSSIRNNIFLNNIMFLPTEQMAMNMRNIYFPNAAVSQIEGAKYFF